MLAENRRKEILREDQLKRITQEKVLEANLSSEERIENKRFLRRIQQEAKEREMDEAIQKVRLLRSALVESNNCKYFSDQFITKYNCVAQTC